MRTIRKAAVTVLAGLALAVSGASAASACTTTTPVTSPTTVTYAFYTTDNGVPAPSKYAPAGYLYQDNTDYEDDAANRNLCEATYLGHHIDVYVCTVPANSATLVDPAYVTTTTDDGDWIYAASGDVLDPINGGPTTLASTRTPAYS